MKIVFEGDSITDTGRNTESGSLVSIGQGYALIASGRLQAKYPGRFSVWNFGVSGDKVPNIYARMQPEVYSLKPDVFSLLVGVNDVGHEISWNGGVDSKRYRTVYSLIIEESLERVPGIRLMLMEPFLLRGSGTAANYNEFRSGVEERAAIVKDLAKTYGQIFVPLQAMLDEAAEASDPGFYLGDGIHPLPAGHTLIADRWLKIFEENFSIQ